MTDLAERIEAATGPDRELDKAIAVASGWCLHPSNRQRNDSAQSDTGYTCLDCGADSWGNTGPTGQKRHAPIPAYTGSIDAAMMLVPEGMRFAIMIVEDGRAAVKLWWPGDDAPNVPRLEPLFATPALALAAAAIRAGAK